MSLQAYTRNVASQPGISPALKLEPGRAYALVVDPARPPKAAKFEQHAVGVELYSEEPGPDGEAVHTWSPVTIYLRARELAELATVCHNEQRTIVQAWVELVPVVNAMTGEVRLRDDGQEVMRRAVRFASPVVESAAEWSDWSAPDRAVQPVPQRVQYARPVLGPPAFVKPAK